MGTLTVFLMPVNVFLECERLQKTDRSDNVSFVLEPQPESKDSSAQILWAILCSVRRH